MTAERTVHTKQQSLAPTGKEFRRTRITSPVRPSLDVIIYVAWGCSNQFSLGAVKEARPQGTGSLHGIRSRV